MLSTDVLFSEFFKQRPPATVRAYTLDLTDFAHFRGTGLPIGALDGLLRTSEDRARSIVESYRDHMQLKQLAPATINRRLFALRSFVRFAHQHGSVAWTLDVARVEPQPHRVTRSPDQARVRALLALVSERQHRDAKGARDAAIVSLRYEAGLTQAAIVRLDVNDAELWSPSSARESTVVLATRELHQNVFEIRRRAITPNTALAINGWLDRRGHEPGPMFFPLDRYGGPRGNRLTVKAIYRLIRELGRKLAARTEAACGWEGFNDNIIIALPLRSDTTSEIMCYPKYPQGSPPNPTADTACYTALAPRDRDIIKRSFDTFIIPLGSIRDTVVRNMCETLKSNWDLFYSQTDPPRVFKSLHTTPPTPPPAPDSAHSGAFDAFGFAIHFETPTLLAAFIAQSTGGIRSQQAREVVETALHEVAHALPENHPAGQKYVGPWFEILDPARANGCLRRP